MLDVEKVKRWYDQGLWTDDMVDQATKKDQLTKAQAAKIKKEGAKK